MRKYKRKHKGTDILEKKNEGWLIFESEREENLQENFLEDFLRLLKNYYFLTKFLPFGLQSLKKRQYTVACTFF